MQTPKNYHGNFEHPERHVQPDILQRQSAPFKYDLIVFSHLRWEFVFQRPQHIISRLSANRKVLFVEEPVHFEPGEENTCKLITVNQHITILQPKVRHMDDIWQVVKKHAGRSVPAAWFYSAAFSPVLEVMNFKTVIYDCMDELSLFKGADPKLIEQEKYLMSKADIVFTGGKSLYESKKQSHHNVHCFPSSVDHLHFRKALNGIAIPQDIRHLKGMVVGYYGVIDERLDLVLLDEVASLNPDSSYVMIGPLAKIQPEDLPRRENIHYYGAREYEQLPNYLKAIDIAMMPFAMNDATRFISPTKTLEFMAAGKPIISTPVYDVVRDYSKHIHIVNNAKEFGKAQDAISKQRDTQAYYSTKYSEILQSTSWDNTVNRMEELISNLAVRVI